MISSFDAIKPSLGNLFQTTASKLLDKINAYPQLSGKFVCKESVDLIKHKSRLIDVMHYVSRIMSPDTTYPALPVNICFNLAKKEIQAIALKIEMIRKKRFPMSETLEIEEYLSPDETCIFEARDSLPIWAKFLSFEHEVFGKLIAAENFALQFFPSSGSQRSFEKEWKYREPIKEINAYKKLFHNIKHRIEAIATNLVQEAEADMSFKSGEKIMLQGLDEAFEELSVLQEQVRVLQESLQISLREEIHIAFDHSSPGMRFFALVKKVLLQSAQLEYGLKTYHLLGSLMNLKDSIKKLFGSYKVFSIRGSELNLLIKNIEWVVRKFEIISGVRTLQDVKTFTEKMGRIGLAGLMICSELQCKLLLQCEEIIHVLIDLISGNGNQDSNDYSTLFTESEKTIKEFYNSTIPILIELVQDISENNNTLIEKLFNEARDFPADQHHKCMDILNQMEVFESAKKRHDEIKMLQISGEFSGDNKQGSLSYSKKLIDIHLEFHQKQQVVISHLNKMMAQFLTERQSEK